MKRDQETGQFVADSTSTMERVYQFIADGVCDRTRIAQELGITRMQVRHAFVNLTNRKRITLVAQGKGKGKGNGKGRQDGFYMPIEEAPVIKPAKRSMFSGANSIFNLAA